MFIKKITNFTFTILNLNMKAEIIMTNKINFNHIHRNLINKNKGSLTFKGSSDIAVSPDTFTPSAVIEVPVISDEQLKKNKITDEQIIQMNKSKKLPNNAQLYGIPAQIRGQRSFKPTYTDRFHYEVKYCHQTPWDKKVKRIIPEGYVAARGPKNKVFVVKKEDVEPITKNNKA